jgi:hypothetical protein
VVEDGAKKRTREKWFTETGRLSTEYADSTCKKQEAAVAEAAAVAAVAAAAITGQEEGSRERRGRRQRTRTETAANPPHFCTYELLRVFCLCKSL